jgi:hypothetical protein
MVYTRNLDSCENVVTLCLGQQRVTEIWSREILMCGGFTVQTILVMNVFI